MDNKLKVVFEQSVFLCEFAALIMERKVDFLEAVSVFSVCKWIGWLYCVLVGVLLFFWGLFFCFLYFLRQQVLYRDG
jgi:UPF0716 family protein affecting phage T7 exclusion